MILIDINNSGLSVLKINNSIYKMFKNYNKVVSLDSLSTMNKTGHPCNIMVFEFTSPLLGSPHIVRKRFSGSVADDNL